MRKDIEIIIEQGTQRLPNAEGRSIRMDGQLFWKSSQS